MSARFWWCVCLAASLSLAASLYAQNYRIDTVAGFGTFGGDGGPATAALVTPGAVVVDGTGVLYVSDSENYRIRRIDSSGNITTLIGKGYGTFFGDGGQAASAGMSTAGSLALDGSGNLYFTDDGNLRIREITTGGTVLTVAGNGSCGTTTAGLRATQAPLCDVESVAVDAQGRVYFGSGSQVWMVAADGTLVLIAGTGGFGSTGDGGPAVSAQIGFPGNMAIDQNGNLYIADQFNFTIREVTTDKVIHTVATINSGNATTVALAVDTSGALFYATGTKQVFKLQGSPVVAGAVTGNDDASNLAIDRTGTLYVSSIATSRLLKISAGSASVIAGAYPFDLDPLPTRPEASVCISIRCSSALRWTPRGTSTFRSWTAILDSASTR